MAPLSSSHAHFYACSSPLTSRPTSSGLTDYDEYDQSHQNAVDPFDSFPSSILSSLSDQPTTPPLLVSVLDPLPQPCLSTASSPFFNNSFLLTTATAIATPTATSKGSASLLSHHVTGSPLEDHLNILTSQPPNPTTTTISDHLALLPKKMSSPPTRPPHHRPLSSNHSPVSDSLDLKHLAHLHPHHSHPLPNHRHRHHHRLGLLLSSSQATLHRNFSDPIKPSNNPSSLHTSLQTASPLPRCLAYKTPPMISHPPPPPLRHRHSNLNDYSHSTSQTLEEENEEEDEDEIDEQTDDDAQQTDDDEAEHYLSPPHPLKSVQYSSPLDPSQSLESITPVSLPPPSSVHLHRASSDRRVYSDRNPFQSSSISNSMSPWPDHTNLRRHQSQQSEGRWAPTSMVATHSSISSGNQVENAPRTTDSKSLVTLDTHYKASPPSAPSSTDPLRSVSNPSTSSTGTPPAFTQNLLSNSPPSLNPISSYSSHIASSVTPIGSPVSSVPAFSLNPWSPTLEEAKKLRDPMLRQASVDNLVSGRAVSPRPPKSATIDSSRYRSASGDDSKSANLNMLHSNLHRLGLSTSDDLNSRSNLSNSTSHRSTTTGKSPLSISTSMADVMSGITSPQDLVNIKSSSATKKMILPPLVTTFPRQTSTPSAGLIGSTHPSIDSTKRNPGACSIPFQGPASAAAYVPPIGHSLQHNSSDAFNLQETMSRMVSHSTAAPGVGASTWSSQKERLVGKPFKSTKDWNSPPMIHSSASPTSLPQSVTSFSTLPHQIQQQMLLNHQLQQLQQLQAQQQLLQQQQAQLLSQGMGLSTTATGLPPLTTNLFQQNSAPNSASSFNLNPFGSALQNNAAYSPSMRFPANHHLTPQNMSPVGSSSSIKFSNIMGASNNSSLPSTNPSRLHTTITGHPDGPLAAMNMSLPPSLLSHSIPASMVGTRDPLVGPPTVGINGVVSNDGLPSASPMISNVDIQQLANRQGYNPLNFNCKPKAARFFVIKSYTEDDVHKSLKYEIWASTDLGNKRLDKAFNESAESGPIYLLFSVNASGHFCGMAEMLTAVDYNTSSKVWAQDKWKGIFKVRWVFVKDIPNNALRHIKLSNTPENKPVTSSRDTQEVPFDKGIEVLQIMASYQSRTTLLQDYAWYEHNESLKGRANEPVTSDEKTAHQQLQQPKFSVENHHPPHQTSFRSTYHQKQQSSAPNSQTIRRFSAVSKVPSASLSLYHPQAPIEITSVI